MRHCRRGGLPNRRRRRDHEEVAALRATHGSDSHAPSSASLVFWRFELSVPAPLVARGCRDDTIVKRPVPMSGALHSAEAQSPLGLRLRDQMRV